MGTRIIFTLLTTTLLNVLVLSSAQADSFGSGGNTFIIDFAPIGNAGNAADTTGYGAVGYNYSISTYAISQQQINLAVANGYSNGTAGNWTGSQPATGITWYQAAAYANWLNTSHGYTAAYNLDAGATTLTVWSQSQAFSLGGGNYDLYRNANAHYFLPTENEYYKAAYYDPNKSGGAGYWLYATGSDTAPTAVASGTAAGTAVYDGYNTGVASVPASVDQAGGLSPYGTMGQTANVSEWNESAYFGGYNASEDRVFRGGIWLNPSSILQSSFRGNANPSITVDSIGFRVAEVVPEPSTYTLLIFGLGSMLGYFRHRNNKQGLQGGA